MLFFCYYLKKFVGIEKLSLATGGREYSPWPADRLRFRFATCQTGTVRGDSLHDVQRK